MSIWPRLWESIRRSGESLSDWLAEVIGVDRGAAVVMALVGLCAKIAKADGEVTPPELVALRSFIVIRDEEIDLYDKIFARAARDAEGYEDFARTVKRLLDDDPAQLERVAEGLISIASADGEFHPNERAMIARIVEIFAIDPVRIRHFEAVCDPNQTDPYRVLGASPEDSEETLRRKRRDLAKRHHPDALAAAPQEFRRMSEERLKRINEAFDAVMAARRRP